MRKLAIILLCLVLISSIVGVAWADDSGFSNPYLVRTLVDEEGREIAEVIVPGQPPEIKAAVATTPDPNPAMGINALSSVPAFDWSYGCFATSAAMLFGYYDNTGYSNMYAGPTNGGICPMDNSVWGSGIGGSNGECPLSATHQGKDGQASKGHVDDYWISYGNTNPDPFIGHWPEHTHGDCTGDYMGTNQSSFGNTDGGTTFFFYLDGAPLYDYRGQEPGRRDGCHGMCLFADSRSYTVITNFSQLIKGQGSDSSKGFTFSNFRAEIDARRPVLIQVEGHSMLGYGYNTAESLVYLHDTWDHSDHQLVWGGTYQGLQHYAVTVVRLKPVGAPNHPPQLSNPSVQPTSGTPSTDFYYYVHYSDSDNDNPTVKQVYIDGTPHTMRLYSGSASNGVYQYGPENLSAGSHNYYLHFEDGKGGTAILPTSGSYSEPTVSQENNPPNTPSKPSPANHAPNASIDANLSWTGGDSDPEDTVTYDIHFGISSPPPLTETIGPHPATQSPITYELETLNYDTKYCWYIVAADNHSAQTPGPVWDFTTGSEPGPITTWKFDWGPSIFPKHLPDTYTGEIVLAALTDVPDEICGVYWPDPEARTWKCFLWVNSVPVSVPAEKRLDTLKAGEDYLVAVLDACTWELS